MKGLKMYQTIAAMALFAASLTACGGGGGGGAAPGAAGAAVSKGVITAKGSVFVNGIEFSIPAGTTIKIDDTPHPEGDLKVGMVVKVRGSSDDITKKGTATEIEAADSLEGRIELVDSANKTITVMGQVVRIEDNVTRLNDDDTNPVKLFSQAGFAAGQPVEVHAFPDDQGGLRAVRAIKKAELEFEGFEIKGFVVSLGTGSFGLSLTPGGASSLTVNFSGTLPGLGSFVEVKSSAAPVGGAITATVVQLEDRLGNAGEKVEVEGIISGGDLSNSIVVNGQQVLISSATFFEGGLRADLALGAKVEAEGPLDASGAIVATKISFRSNIKIEADVTAFTPGTSITLLGKTVAINSFTRIDGAVTTRAEVRAMLDRDGNLIATRIVAKGPDSNQRAFLQGPVANVNAAAGTFSILNVSIVTNAATKFELDSDSSSEITIPPATFFAGLTNNVTVVKVRWRPFINTSAAVEQAEIELGN